MKVKELIKSLLDYNMDADVDVIANNTRQEFTLTYGGHTDGEGTPKAKTSAVGIYVDALCQNESE